MPNKRFILILSGALSAIAAVLVITPPGFSRGSNLSPLKPHAISNNPTNPTPTNPTPTNPTPTNPSQNNPSTPITNSSKKNSKSNEHTNSGSNNNPNSNISNPAPKNTTSPSPTKPSGNFIGDTSDTPYGPVQVAITLVNGKITSAKALQTPNNDPRSQYIASQAVPYLIEETLSAQSANIQGVSGASYTSQGWYNSLASALSKAGLNN